MMRESLDPAGTAGIAGPSGARGMGGTDTPPPAAGAPAIAPGASRPVAGPSAEMRRFSAGLRVVTALMCSMLLISSKPAIDLDAGPRCWSTSPGPAC
jgi:hypothetical protein